jgi:hypothetical protein
MDATLIETHKREALPCYKGFKAYQPLNCWWAEQGVVLHSEFRDGNVPAGYQQLRVLKDCLATAAAVGVTKVYLRSDSAGYQQDLLLYCGEGKDARFGVIEFAVSADVTEEFRRAVRAVAEADWQPLYRTVEGEHYRTDQEFAEVCFVPNWAGHSRKRADYRFLAIREPLRQLDLDDAAQLPFPTEEFAAKGRFKLFGIVTNRTLPGDQVIWWLRERCGKSEEVHAVMKTDLAGGRMPSGLFGANAAWWTIMILAHNLNAVMKRLVLGPAWVARRMKALRFSLINLPGRIIRHGRRLIIRVVGAGETLALLLSARRTILALAVAPSGCRSAPSPDSTDDSSTATPAIPALASGPADLPASRLVPAAQTRKARSRTSHGLTMPALRPAPTEERVPYHLTTLSLPAVIRDPRAIG